MEILAGTAEFLSPSLLAGVARYRYKVFVEGLGWPIPGAVDGLEFDQFDGLETRYIVCRDSRGNVVGTARLLPTTRPYLLQEMFPQLLGGTPAPCATDVWELSRFAAVDFNSPSNTALSQFMSPLAFELLTAALRYAASHGVTRLITVSPLGIERLLRNGGFSARRAAPPVRLNGQDLFACWIQCTVPEAVGPEPSRADRSFLASDSKY